MNSVATLGGKMAIEAFSPLRRLRRHLSRRARLAEDFVIAALGEKMAISAFNGLKRISQRTPALSYSIILPSERRTAASKNSLVSKELCDSGCLPLLAEQPPEFCFF